MDDKNNKMDSPFEPETRSAFPARKSETPADKSNEKPIPSQPRSFSPVRPQPAPKPRKELSSIADKAVANNTPAKGNPVGPVASVPTASDGPVKTTGSSANPEAKAESASPKSPVAPASSSPASPAAAPSATTAASKTEPTGVNTPASTAAATGATKTPPPQSSGAGGDTIRLRVQPRPQARSLNTAPGRGLRRRLPDIRQGKNATSTASYGPFAMLFGFLWLIFKMVFFTALVLGLGALIGFMVMTQYIKTPEVTVPNVSGMKVDEAFAVLSDKNLGIIRLRTESSGLVAPGEIISQQPPAGAEAKVKTHVGVVISSGRSQFVVPNVVNETRENAENKIRGARLTVGSVLSVEDSTIARGNVISQSPIGGQGFDEVTEVNLMISAGPQGKSLSMPDFSGRSVLEAKAALKAVGVDNVVTVPPDAAPDAKVLSHDPLVGKTVFQTDKVTLTTGKK